MYSHLEVFFMSDETKDGTEFEAELARVMALFEPPNPTEMTMSIADLEKFCLVQLANTHQSPTVAISMTNGMNGVNVEFLSNVVRLCRLYNQLSDYSEAEALRRIQERLLRRR